MQHIPGVYLTSEGHVRGRNIQYMRPVPGSAGAIGVATLCHQMVKLALRFVLRGGLSQSVRSFSNTEHQEADCRIKPDHAYSQPPCDTFHVCVYTSDDDFHPDAHYMVKIATGKKPTLMKIQIMLSTWDNGNALIV